MDGGDFTVAGAALRAVVPPDDAGAETLDRYEWQAMMATADLLALYYDALSLGLDPSTVIDCGLVCEYHEDWSWVRAADMQLVSGKHKEPRFGAYTTTASLLDDGGLFHLFDRWHALGRGSTCRLVTTAGLDRDAAAVNDLCEHYRAGTPQTTSTKAAPPHKSG